ncbi:MAG: M23 family metallopeptidase [Chloroflexota bacterium]
MTHTSTAAPIQPTATQPPTPTPSATPVDPGAGLPCPVDAPIKPDYVYGGVGDAPLPDGDPARTSPHLWLGNPLSAEGLPVINRITYGSDSNGRYLLHNGLDFIDDPGAPLLAVADGTVIVAGPDDERLFGWRCDWYGHLVVVQLDQTWDGEPVYVLYGHVLDIVVSLANMYSRDNLSQQLASAVWRRRPFAP